MTAGRLSIALLWAGTPAAQTFIQMSDPEAPSAERIDPSMVQLVADQAGTTAEQCESSFCHLEFEGNALYLHREDSGQMILKNAIWLSAGWPIPEDRRTLSGAKSLRGRGAARQ